MTQWHSRRPELVRNLVTNYERASAHAKAAGAAWYPAARRIVREWAGTYNLPVNTVASVIAALSPQCQWERNLIIADDILAERAISVSGVFHSNIRKARQIREAKTGQLADLMTLFPQGPKVNCFAWNLAGHDNIVTVDTHGIQIALDDVKSTVTLRWAPYKVFAECYATAAARVGLTPATFQAIVWVSWKERYPRVRKIQARARW